MSVFRMLAPLLLLARRFVRREEGVAATEMALITPMLLVLFLGSTETGLLVRMHFQAAHMASTVADVIARYKSVTSADISGIFAVSAEVMGTGDFDENGTVVLSSIATDDKGNATVAWQCAGGKLGSNSRIGTTGKAASLPSGLALGKNDNIIVAEIFYRYTPLLGWTAPGMTLAYKTALFRPRLGDLTTAPGC
ncbi:TadE/TadG family type IV pilus assembly protein [Mesorhizobium sp. 1B3]|uniref:TadE/TadG family type IV pilus assembly protein n=1 Tax=Mesorhizobium sp. 1B3 TaxID=3243599 RepID=UPI003D96C0DF